MQRCSLPTKNYTHDNYSHFKVFFAIVWLFKFQMNNKTLTTHLVEWHTMAILLIKHKVLKYKIILLHNYKPCAILLHYLKKFLLLLIKIMNYQGPISIYLVNIFERRPRHMRICRLSTENYVHDILSNFKVFFCFYLPFQIPN